MTFTASRKHFRVNDWIGIDRGRDPFTGDLIVLSRQHGVLRVARYLPTSTNRVFVTVYRGESYRDALAAFRAHVFRYA